MSPVSDEQAAAFLRSNPGFRQATGNDFEATGQTVRYMCSLINRSTDASIVERAWQDAWERFSAMTGGDPAQCAWWYAKTLITFVHHSKMAGAWLGDPSALQLLIEPAALLKMRDPKGDCAVFTTLICALLKEAGVPWEIVTVAVDPRYPGIFSHVYPRAVLADGSRLPLDASHGSFPGWEVPAQRVTRKQAWGESGWPVSDETNEGANGMAGLGCACKNGMGDTPIDFSAIDYDPVSTNWAGLTDSGFPSSSPSGWGSPAVTNTLGNLASAWTGIASNILAPMTTYKGANGSVLSTPANQTANAALLTGGGSLLSSSGSSSLSGMLPILLIGGAALFLVSKMAK